MAIRHGNKTYMQILLDPHRAELLLDHAKALSVRPTAWIREAVYSALQNELPAADYNDAMEKDADTWKASVRNRVQGRMNSRNADKG